MLIIGIDPGINGAICLFKDGKIVDVFEMPKMAVGKKNKSQVNASQIFNEIQKAFWISLNIWEALTWDLFFFPTAIFGISNTSTIFPSLNKHIAPLIPGSIPIINIA